MVLNHSLTDQREFNTLFQPHVFLINSHNPENTLFWPNNEKLIKNLITAVLSLNTPLDFSPFDDSFS